MKKAFTFLLAIAMMLTFFGCSNGNTSSKGAMTQEEMLAEATEMTGEMWKKAAENNAYAESLVGNVYSFMGIVSDIEADYAVMSVKHDYSFISGFLTLHVYLPSEQLIELKQGLQLSVVGKIEEMKNEELQVSGTKENQAVYVMNLAYVVEDHFVFEGELLGENKSYGGWNVVIGDSDIAYIVHFADGVDTSNFKYAQKIKFLARFFGGSFDDATIVE